MIRIGTVSYLSFFIRTEMTGDKKECGFYQSGTIQFLGLVLPFYPVQNSEEYR